MPSGVFNDLARTPELRGLRTVVPEFFCSCGLDEGAKDVTGKEVEDCGLCPWSTVVFACSLPRAVGFSLHKSEAHRLFEGRGKPPETLENACGVSR